MKILYFLLISSIIIQTVSSVDLESLNLFDSEYLAILRKECDTISFENQALCEKLRKMEMRTTTKVMSRVEAVIHKQDNFTDYEKNDLFNLAMPINTCRNEDCEFCCLSTNRCGTKKQCTNRDNYLKYINGVFIFVCFILIFALMIKCFQIDANPDQMNTEKIDNNDLNELISMFSIIRNNRKKLIS